MKILLVIPSLRGGGAERVASLLSLEWAKTHEVALAVFDSSRMAYEHGGRLIDLGLPARPGPFGKLWNSMIRVLRLIRLIRSEEPQCIVSFMESANFPAILAATCCGRLGALTASVHGNPSRYPVFYRCLLPIAYRLPKRLVAVSRGVAKTLIRLGVPQRKVDVIPNPVLLPRSFKAGDKGAGLALCRPCPFVLGVGRLCLEKGFERLIAAFALLGVVETELVILGEGPERSHLLGVARGLGIEHRLVLPGLVPDPAPWYRAAECMVLSSRHEGFGNVIVEAMANACPVVSFDCDFGPREIIRHGKSGLLVPEGDILALSQSMARVLGDKTLKWELVRCGINAAEGYRADRIAQRWMAA